VTADAGMTSLENATLVHEELHASSLFALEGTQPELLAEAERLLGHLQRDKAAACTIETVGGKQERRLLWSTVEMAEYNGWTHQRLVLRVCWETVAKDGTIIAKMDRYFITNVAPGDYTARQWLDIIRAHWQVENGIHKTLDVPRSRLCGDEGGGGARGADSAATKAGAEPEEPTLRRRRRGGARFEKTTGPGPATPPPCSP
jgi:hypothetical protein